MANTGCHIIQESLERVAVFIEWSDEQATFQDLGQELDPAQLRDYLIEGREPVEAVVYLWVDPGHLDAGLALVRSLRSQEFVVHSETAKVLDNGNLKCNFHVAMALDVWDFVQAVRTDIVVIGSGDGDYVPLVERLQMLGIRVEVAATPGTISQDLLESSDGFIDLTQMGDVELSPETAEKGGEGSEENRDAEAIEAEAGLTRLEEEE